MEFRDFTAGQNDNDRRLDRVLRKFLEDKSLSEIYKLLRKGLIKLNHAKAKPETHVAEGDVISIAGFLFDSKESVSQPAASPTAPHATPLQIVFENQHLLIINKPYDQTVHGEKDGLYKDVLEYYKTNCAAQNNSLSFKPGPLHRLDRRTTGLLVFSKSLEGARWFSESIKNHTVTKKYYALLTGNLTQQCEWQDYIKDADEESEGFHKVRASEDDTGALAVSIVTPLAHGTCGKTLVTLAEFDIKTGRKHQIRAQSALHKHALLGDTAYGAAPLSNNKNPGRREFYLQAYSLSFPKDNPLEMPENIKIGLSSDFLCQIEYCEIENPGL